MTGELRNVVETDIAELANRANPWQTSDYGSWSAGSA